MITDVLVRRHDGGYQVESRHQRSDIPNVESAGDLIEALVLADIIAADAGMPLGTRRPNDEPDVVSQLQHALATRVSIEQAIGVLCERHGLSPRDAFEKMRTQARTDGRRMHRVADDVLASVYT